MTFKRLIFSLPFLCLLVSSLFSSILRAQVVPSAFKSPISLTVGGIGSAFDPDYIPYKAIGVGAYVDVNVFHGFGVEAEGRWQRFREYQGIYQDNYLIGPRVRLHHLWRARPYVKALGGFSNMNFGYEYGGVSGRFTTFAAGGGVDIQVSRRLSVRAADIEYQWWPEFLNSSLTPYGISAGVGYRIF